MAEESLNCFGRFGCIVKNPAATIKFAGATYGDLSLRDAITPSRLFAGVLYMSEIPIGQISSFMEKHGDEKVTITNNENGKSASITMKELEMCERSQGCDAWLKMVGELR